jgi:hypothetical protein
VRLACVDGHEVDPMREVQLEPSPAPDWR